MQVCKGKSQEKVAFTFTIKEKNNVSTVRFIGQVICYDKDTEKERMCLYGNDFSDVFIYDGCCGHCWSCRIHRGTAGKSKAQSADATEKRKNPQISGTAEVALCLWLGAKVDNKKKLSNDKSFLFSEKSFGHVPTIHCTAAIVAECGSRFGNQRKMQSVFSVVHPLYFRIVVPWQGQRRQKG